ncbi:MAG: transporter [Alistipes sp.]|nr:transporter [Alistipes sp.]
MLKPSAHMMRTMAMPLGMLTGALFCREMEWLESATQGWLTPMFIGSMLFVTFCKVDARQIRLQMMHLWLIMFQAIGCFVVYYATLPFGEVVAQGAMICVLAPIAMGAVVIGGMLGAKVETMVAYSLLCNIAVAIFAPVVLSVYGNGTCSVGEILGRVAPMLILPFVLAQLCRLFTPKVSGWVAAHGQISFYIWLLSLIVIIGRTTCFIIDHSEADRLTELLLGIVALVICATQFIVGRIIGRKYGDASAGGQSLGQKNTVMAVWMAQSFLDPLSSVAPTAYIVWQNLVNSYQLYRFGNRKADKANK